ncbi:hypothetical protein [Gracilibacillus xinjiangensis]|uniref:Uncharacterized protein n=1 Tax=Gracilibacillus xinjiangensis TaxID=1193282 RepID=A0ABV8WV01_9BACI
MDEQLVVLYFDQWTIIGFIFLFFWLIVFAIDIYFNFQKRKEMKRLKEFNDGLERLLNLPIKDFKRKIRNGHSECD